MASSLQTIDYFALLFGSALLTAWLSAKLSARSPAAHVWFAPASTLLFAVVLYTSLPPQSLPARAALCGVVLLSLGIVYRVRAARYGVWIVFAILIGVDLAEQLLNRLPAFALRNESGLALKHTLAPLGFSYLLFRWFDAWRYHARIRTSRSVHPGARLARVLLQSAALPTLPSGPIVMAGQHRVVRTGFEPGVLFYRRAVLLCALGFLKVLVFEPVLRAHFSSGLVLAPAFSLEFAGNALATGLYCYARLFLNFSGYSDLAVGLCGILGLRIRHNFARPYAAVSLREFWRRWHITLGAFLRRHVYLPLGGNRRRHTGNLLLVFLLLGVWHGASIPFVLWGLVHGLYLVFEIRVLTPWRQRAMSRFETRPIIQRLCIALQYALTQLFVTLSWLLFSVPGGRLHV